jgi:hypothetical protein
MNGMSLPLQCMQPSHVRRPGLYLCRGWGGEARGGRLCGSYARASGPGLSNTPTPPQGRDSARDCLASNYRVFLPIWEESFCLPGVTLRYTAT